MGIPMTESRGERLLRLMMEGGLSQSVVAARVGCSQALISRVLSGQANLTEKLARKLEGVLNVSFMYLLYGTGDQKPRRARNAEEQGERELAALESVVNEGLVYQFERTGLTIKVAGRVAADATSNIEWAEGEADFGTVTIPNRLRYYEVKGYSMAPVLWEGQWVGVDWTAEPSSGDIGAFVLRNGVQLVKRLWIEGDDYRLVSLRPTDPRRAEPPEPDLVVKRGQIKRMGKVRVHILY